MNAFDRFVYLTIAGLYLLIAAGSGGAKAYLAIALCYAALSALP